VERRPSKTASTAYLIEVDNKWLKRWHDFLVVVILLECIYTPLECGFNGLCPLFLRL
jgi:hypothetical protein